MFYLSNLHPIYHRISIDSICPYIILIDDRWVEDANETRYKNPSTSSPTQTIYRFSVGQWVAGSNSLAKHEMPRAEKHHFGIMNS